MRAVLEVNLINSVMRTWIPQVTMFTNKVYSMLHKGNKVSLVPTINDKPSQT